MISDHAPFSFTNTANGKRRHIAGLEADTGAMPITAKDKSRTALIRKFEHIIWLIESGTLEREYKFGKQFFFLFVTRTEVRMQSAMYWLEILTRHNPALRAHIAFKRHPVYGKSADKPRATSHMLTEPWKRTNYDDLYLSKPNEQSNAGRKDTASEGAHRAA